jgi:hypothetical protein
MSEENVQCINIPIPAMFSSLNDPSIIMVIFNNDSNTILSELLHFLCQITHQRTQCVYFPIILFWNFNV